MVNEQIKFAFELILLFFLISLSVTLEPIMVLCNVLSTKQAFLKLSKFSSLVLKNSSCLGTLQIFKVQMTCFIRIRWTAVLKFTRTDLCVADCLVIVNM